MKKLVLLFVILIACAAQPAQAVLTVNDLIEQQVLEIKAKSYVVMDQVTGEIVAQKSPELAWVPASLTKVVSALVVLDTGVSFKKVCTITKEDEVGGARLNATINGKYYLGDLVNAAIVSSANNAANAMADCVLSRDEFVKAMNAKAAQLGAKNTHFVEPSGIDPKNISTAIDLAHIMRAGFSTLKIQEIALRKNVSIYSVSKPKRNHYLTSTNQILREGSISVLAGKTGYLDESLYNFALSSKAGDRYLITVVLGNPTKAGSFADTKNLVTYARSKGNALAAANSR